MYEIFALLATLLLAKHGKGGRKMGRYIKGNIQVDLALGTLATKTAVSIAVASTVSERAWLSSVKASWTLSDVTTGPNIGPVLVVLAHSDYTNAEIEAWIELDTGWAEADLVSQEVAKRKIRRVGVFRRPDTGQQSRLNDGKPITTKCGWILNAGQSIDVVAYNMGTAAFATTSPNVNCQGHANLWPR